MLSLPVVAEIMSQVMCMSQVCYLQVDYRRMCRVLTQLVHISRNREV